MSERCHHANGARQTGGRCTRDAEEGERYCRQHLELRREWRGQLGPRYYIRGEDPVRYVDDEARFG